MEFPSHGNTEAGAAVGVRAALQRFLHEARRCGWQALLVGSGFWLRAAVCTKRFVVDLANALELRTLPSDKAVAGHWSSRIVNRMRGGLVRAVRWCAPAAGAWQRLAARTDLALLERCNPILKDYCGRTRSL